jgi:DNA-binding MarR family transcriptional regulator
MGEDLESTTRTSHADRSTTSRKRAGPASREAAAADQHAPFGGERPFLSVAFTISTTGYALRQRFHELLEPLGIDAQDLGLLQALGRREGVTQQAIADQINVAPSRMTVLLDALEQRGLLERRPNHNDRRARALFLTPQGHELLARAFAIALEHEQQLTSDLTDNERTQLLNLLARIGAHVGIPPGVHTGMGHTALHEQTTRSHREP